MEEAAVSASPEREAGVTNDESRRLSRKRSYGAEHKKLNLFNLQRGGLGGIEQTLASM